jgi:phage shock protein PspC (stress-responsive transcriptional regulator)
VQQETSQRWYRGSDRILGGVCSGLATGLQVDSLWIRIAFVLLALVQGIGVVLYIVLWVVMPERAGAQPTGRSRFDSMTVDVRRAWHDLQGQFGGTRHAGPAGTASPATEDQSVWRNPSVGLGLVLLVVGFLFLATNLGFVSWNVIWPVALIVIGVLLLARRVARRS